VRSGSPPGGSGRAVARVAAPAAFLLAVTIAVLLARSALRDPAPPARTPTAATTQPSTRTTTTGRTTTATTEARQSYTIQAGDTLAVVAARFNTTVEHLVELNPGIDPTALQVGQQIRVK